MKKSLLTILFVLLSILAFDSNVLAQGKNVEPQIKRDPVLEQDSQKNLDAARHYFTTKKAYKAALLRLDEIIAANPNFARMDEVLYLFGMSNLYLSEGKGKQKIDPAKEKDKERFTPARLREEAVANLSLLIKSYPNSEFAAEAKKTLDKIDA